MTDYGRGRAAALRAWLHEAIEAHRPLGTLPTSLRHLYYEAVMAGVISKTARGARRSDQAIIDAATWLRQQGLVPWQYIEDRTRHLIDHRGYASVIEAAREATEHARLDPWTDLVPVLVTESESVAGVLDRLAFEYRVLIVPVRGQANGWLRTAVADALGSRRQVTVGYLGDFDKAGVDIEVNAERVLASVARVDGWERLALTRHQIDLHGLPLVERTDRRDGRTRLVCEIEALPQALLEAAVRAWLDDLLPEPLVDVQEREAAERADVLDLLG